MGTKEESERSFTVSVYDSKISDECITGAIMEILHDRCNIKHISVIVNDAESHLATVDAKTI